MFLQTGLTRFPTHECLLKAGTNYQFFFESFRNCIQVTSRVEKINIYFENATKYLRYAWWPLEFCLQCTSALFCCTKFTMFRFFFLLEHLWCRTQWMCTEKVVSLVVRDADCGWFVSDHARLKDGTLNPLFTTISNIQHNILKSFSKVDMCQEKTKWKCYQKAADKVFTFLTMPFTFIQINTFHFTIRPIFSLT